MKLGPYLILVSGLTVAFAAGSLAAGDPVAGERAFATTCSECHASVSRVLVPIRAKSIDERTTWLERLLQRHHTPNDRIRADVAAYLLSKSLPPGKGSD